MIKILIHLEKVRERAQNVLRNVSDIDDCEDIDEPVVVNEDINESVKPVKGVLVGCISESGSVFYVAPEEVFLNIGEVLETAKPTVTYTKEQICGHGSSTKVTSEDKCKSTFTVSDSWNDHHTTTFTIVNPGVIDIPFVAPVRKDPLAPPDNWYRPHLLPYSKRRHYLPFIFRRRC